MSQQTDKRRRHILERLRSEGFCSVTWLAEHLSVSEVTIRNDLQLLEREGQITRIHGGAVRASDGARSNHFAARALVNQDKKRRIARYAAQQVEDYDSIILDASTTAFYMAEYLRERQGLTVFTNGIEVGLLLADNPTNKVVLTGGLLRSETASLGGNFGNGVLAGVRASKAFISGTGWSVGLDLMDDDLFEVQTKSAMVESAETAFALVDSGKFRKQGVASFVPIERLQCVITDDQIDDADINRFRNAGARVTICGQLATRIIEAGNTGRAFRIGFANQDDAAPFSTLVRQGLVQAAHANNIDLLLTDNHEDGPQALANIEHFLREQVDLVVEFSTDARYSNIIMERLRSQGISAIAIDIPMPGATFVGVDNYKAGLMGGRLLASYITQQWQGSLHKVLSLELPRSGPVPAARMQGQLDGLREQIAVADENIIHIDSQNTYGEARRAVGEVLPTLPPAQRIALLCINDETALGALAAFAEQGSTDRVVMVGQGADQAALKELLRPGSRMIGAVAYFPELYGDTIIRLALDQLNGKQLPPAVYTSHVLVLADETLRTLDLALLGYDMMSAQDYAELQRGRPDSAAAEQPMHAAATAARMHIG